TIEHPTLIFRYQCHDDLCLIGVNRWPSRAPMPDISPNPDAPAQAAPAARFEGPVVKADQLTVRYGKNRALNDVTAVFPPGAVGLLGPNGAGKSTLLKELRGFLVT